MRMITEEQARQLRYCPNCGKPKKVGMVVCWECFKHIDIPLKYYEGSFEEWLMEGFKNLNQPPKEKRIVNEDNKQ